MDKSEKVVEMLAVMKEAIRMGEENSMLQQEIMPRLSTEIKGLTELLEISQKNKPTVKAARTVPNVDKEIQTDGVLDDSSSDQEVEAAAVTLPKIHKEVQTEGVPDDSNVDQEVTVTLPMPQQSKSSSHTSRLYVWNIPFRWVERHVACCFENYGISVENIDITYNDRGSKGQVFVSVTPLDAQKAKLLMHNSRHEGRDIKVMDAAPKKIYNSIIS